MLEQRRHDGQPKADQTRGGGKEERQEDADGDSVGDLCDSCPADPENDWDEDGVCGNSDGCPLDPANDGDGDGVCAPSDGCPSFANASYHEALMCRLADGFESGNTSGWTTTSP